MADAEDSHAKDRLNPNSTSSLTSSSSNGQNYVTESNADIAAQVVHEFDSEENCADAAQGDMEEVDLGNGKDPQSPMDNEDDSMNPFADGNAADADETTRDAPSLSVSTSQSSHGTSEKKSHKEKKKFSMQKMKQNIKAFASDTKAKLSGKKKLFGVALDEVEVDEGGIPTVVKDCTDYLRSKLGTSDLEGVFRIPGSAAEIRELKDLYHKSKTGHVSQEILASKGVATVAALLKLFFRELPEPLLTYEMYDMFLAVSSIPVSEETLYTRIQTLRKIISYLPSHNALVLVHLISLLHDISKESDLNKMTFGNLAVCFAPNLLKLRPSPDKLSMNETKEGFNLGAELLDTGASSKVVELLIKDYDEIFYDDFPQEASNDNTEDHQARNHSPTSGFMLSYDSIRNNHQKLIAAQAEVQTVDKPHQANSFAKEGRNLLDGVSRKMGKLKLLSIGNIGKSSSTTSTHSKASNQPEIVVQETTQHIPVPIRKDTMAPRKLTGPRENPFAKKTTEEKADNGTEANTAGKPPPVRKDTIYALGDMDVIQAALKTVDDEGKPVPVPPRRNISDLFARPSDPPTLYEADKIVAPSRFDSIQPAEVESSEESVYEDAVEHTNSENTDNQEEITINMDGAVLASVKPRSTGSSRTSLPKSEDLSMEGQDSVKSE